MIGSQLLQRLVTRDAADTPLRVGLIGAGKFGMMLLSQARRVAGLRGEPTGSPTGFPGDVVATAKQALTAGEVLDGEGGYCVYGALRPAEAALKAEGLPIGLAHQVLCAEPMSNMMPPIRLFVSAGRWRRSGLEEGGRGGRLEDWKIWRVGKMEEGKSRRIGRMEKWKIFNSLEKTVFNALRGLPNPRHSFNKAAIWQSLASNTKKNQNF